MTVTRAMRRVEALEAATGGGGECPECGGPDDPGDFSGYEVR